MKLGFILLITAVSGYSIGLIADAIAHTEDSRILSTSKTGKFGPEWLPINFDNEIFEINSFAKTFPFGGGPYYFVETAYLSEDSSNVFEHAKIDFKMSKNQKSDGTFENRVTGCMFETDVDVNTECVVCLLKDGNGVNIAKGEQYFEPPYTANTQLSLDMTDFLFDDQEITDVRNVKGVEIGICEDKIEGE